MSLPYALYEEEEPVFYQCSCCEQSLSRAKPFSDMYVQVPYRADTVLCQTCHLYGIEKQRICPCRLFFRQLPHPTQGSLPAVRLVWNTHCPQCYLWAGVCHSCLVQGVDLSERPEPMDYARFCTLEPDAPATYAEFIAQMDSLT
jgi:hypothetical protein